MLQEDNTINRPGALGDGPPPAQSRRHGAGAGLEVTLQTVRAVISAWTGIPVEQLGQAEVGPEQLQNLAAALQERVIGQDHALDALSQALHRRVALGGAERPIGVFLLVGPSGVGKTETAKTLARHLFGSEQRLLRFDMSEYSEPHTKSRLLGAPPGYIGHDEGGALTEALKRQRFAVLLFDEIEKAHPQVLTVLLQLMDDGRLTDASGVMVDCRHTVVILTSNLGNGYANESRAGFRLPHSDLRPGDREDAERRLERDTERRVMEAVQQFLPPEFLGRLDQVLVFRRLGVVELRQVVQRELGVLAERMGQGLTIHASDLALRILAEQSVDLDSGARAVRRTLQRQVEPGLIQLHAQGLLVPMASHIFIDIGDDGHFLFTAQSSLPSERALDEPVATVASVPQSMPSDSVAPVSPAPHSLSASSALESATPEESSSVEPKGGAT